MGQKIKVDLSGIETFQRASEGEHVCKIASAEVKQSQGGNDMIVIAFEVTKGADKGARVYENYPLIDTALWKLKTLLQALGMKADGKVQLDLDKLTGRTLIVSVIHEEYDGKTRARVESVSKLVAAASDDEDEFDDEDEDEFDDEEAEEEVEEKKPAKKPAAKKATSKKKAEPEPEDDDDDDDWDEEEEEEEKPAPKKAAKKAPAKKATKKPAKKEEPEEEEDDDWDDDDDWDEE